MIRSENLLFIIPLTLRKLLPPMIFSAASSQIATTLASFIIISIFCGTDGLAVLALFLPLNYLWDVLDDAMGLGGTTLFAVSKGKRDPAQSQAIISQSLTFVFLFAAVLSLLCYLLSPILLTKYGFKPEVLTQAITYGQWFGLAMGANVFSNVIRYFVNSDSNPKLALNAANVKQALTILLQLLFLGYMGTGIIGSLYAMILAGLASTAISSLHFLWHKSSRLHFSLLSRKNMLSIGKLSSSKLIENIGIGLIGFIFNIMLYEQFGNLAIVTQCALLTIYSVVLSITGPIIYAGCQLTGLYLGEKDSDGIKYTGQCILKICMATVLGLIFLLELFPMQTAFLLALNIASSSSEWMVALRLFAPSLALSVLNLALLSYYQTIGRAKIVFPLAIIRSIAAPLVCGLVIMQVHSLDLFWLYYLLAEFLTLLLIGSAIFWEKQKKQYPTFWMLSEKDHGHIFRYDFIMKPGDPEINLYFEMAAIFFHKHLEISTEKIDSLVGTMRHLYEYAAMHCAKKNPVVYLRLETIPQVRVSISARWLGKNLNLSATRTDKSWLELSDQSDTAFSDSIYGFNYVGLQFDPQKQHDK